MPSANPDTDLDPQAAQPASPSPSPPPTPPTQATPGPRATAFLTLYTSALDSTLKSISYNSFSSCFPTIAQNASPALKAMHAGMIERLREFATEEFETILRERAVVERVNALEERIGEARRRRGRGVDGGVEGEEVPVPPHTLPPLPLIHSHTLPLHIAQNSQLNARLQTTQSQNASLAEEIRKQREEIEELLRMVEKGVADVENAGDRLGEKVGGLSKDGRAAMEVLGAMR